MYRPNSTKLHWFKQLKFQKLQAYFATSFAVSAFCDGRDSLFLTDSKSRSSSRHWDSSCSRCFLSRPTPACSSAICECTCQWTQTVIDKTSTFFTIHELYHYITSSNASTSIYWHSFGPKAEQLDKTRKSLKTCKQHNKPTKWREGSSPLAVTGWSLVMI